MSQAAGYLLWVAAGGVLGLAHTALLIRTVARLRPAGNRSVWYWVLRDYLARYLLVVGVLLLAFRQGAGAGVCVVVGLWLARWAGVYLGQSGALDWSKLG